MPCCCIHCEVCAERAPDAVAKREADERLAEALAACTAALNVEHKIREALREASLFQTGFAEERIASFIMGIVGGVTDACQAEANAAAEQLSALEATLEKW